MKRALEIISLLTLVALGAAIVGQVLIAALSLDMSVHYTPSGELTDLRQPAVVVSALAVLDTILAILLALATFVLGVVAVVLDKRYRWLVPVVIGSLLAFAGLVWMAWGRLFSQQSSPIAFQAPLVAIPVIMALYGLFPTLGHRAQAGIS